MVICSPSFVFRIMKKTPISSVGFVVFIHYCDRIIQFYGVIEENNDTGSNIG